MERISQIIKETIKLISSLLEYPEHRRIQKQQELKRKDIQMIRAYSESAEFAESQGLSTVADYLRKKADIIIKYPN